MGRLKDKKERAMKRLMMTMVVGAVFAAAAAPRPHIFPQVLPEDEPTIRANVESWKAAPAKNGMARRSPTPSVR